jgi:hypothetical protein
MCWWWPLVELLYRFLGARKDFLYDPLFCIRITPAFKRWAIDSHLWPAASVVAERLLSKFGICAYASLLTGVHDPSVTRTQLVTGYADMCVAVAAPCFLWKNAKAPFLSHRRLAAAPLPEGWCRVTEEERVRYDVYFQERSLRTIEGAMLNERIERNYSRRCGRVQPMVCRSE